ncbi:peptide-methionine (S)-S-oxide reductase MsrA [Corynebacterium sp.]|uniref:peptide-methionine (S)-S-oxide reductase MsrA n=1 Tax=Corynebacterium sp. TaxID=1720 RepID=UPI0026DB707F|nr:peptide-methionine (S)-S-oxide reductase MsrA [Corynebacterium sp.]MDO5076697.1 peptide-methionine (S)-S-oxide reductase MsrA [Corynebacterium sp.]
MGWIFGRQARMVTQSEALPGRDTPVLEDPKPHAVLGTPITGPWRAGQRSVLVGIGCFWGAEKLLWNLPGVESTSVGYAGGFTPNPTYREVCSGQTGHAEVVEVVYDPERISLDEIVTVALENHDPTQGNRQGNDTGTQYRSVFYTLGQTARDDAALIQRRLDEYAPRLAAHGFGPITTEVAELSGAYYRAEDYHQQYLEKNPTGYCPVHATGVTCG